MSGAKKGILRVLKLARRAQPAAVQPAMAPVPPAQPLPGGDAQRLMFRAAETSRTLRGRNIDLNGRRDDLRKEIEDLADAGNIQGATTKAAAFETLAASAMAWRDRAGELATARQQAGGLKSGGDPTADTLAGGLDRAEQEAAGNRYVAAGALLDGATAAIAARVQAWPLIARADAARTKAEKAGLDLGGQRDTLRQEIEDLATRADYAGAGTRAGAFEVRVDGAIAWQGRAGDIDKARRQATFLKSGGDPTADALLAGLKAADDEAAAGRYTEATQLIGPAITAITERAPEWKLLRQHAVEMARLKPGLDLAVSDIPGQGDATHALAAEWQALDDARVDCPDDPGALSPADLAGRRKDLTDALTALNRAYGSRPLGDATEEAARDGWGDKQADLLEAKYAPLWQKVQYVRVRTSKQQALLDEYKAMTVTGVDWTQIHDGIEAKAAKAAQLLAVSANLVGDIGEHAWFSGFGKVRDRVEAASRLTDDTEPTKTRIATFTSLWTEVDALVKGTAADRFTRAGAKLAALVTAADDVLKSRVDAATALVAGIGAATRGATATDPTTPATPAQRAQRALAASQVMPEEIRTVVLRQLPVEAKLALLDGLRADGGPPDFTQTGTRGLPGYSDNADDPVRRAQRDIYMAMDLDPAFVADEKEQRKEVLKELMKDKAELQRARDEWPALDEAARIKVMEKIVAAHCKAMGFDEPRNPGAGPNQGKAIVVLDVGQSSNNGSYDPGTDTIQVNRGGALYGDFELMMDLIFHENSHNKQIKLANRLDLPDTDPNKLTRTNTDPPYTQALMWRANWPGGYVGGDEDYATYQKQPLEEHSWMAGPGTARQLMRQLAR